MVHPYGPQTKHYKGTALQLDSGGTTVFNRPPDKSVYLKIIFLYSQPKPMFWVLKRTVSVFEHPKHMFKLMSKKIITILQKIFTKFIIFLVHVYILLVCFLYVMVIYMSLGKYQILQYPHPSGRTSHFAGFVVNWLIFYKESKLA